MAIRVMDLADTDTVGDAIARDRSRDRPADTRRSRNFPSTVKESG